MRTLEGTSRHPGIAIAVAAVVDAKMGINGVSPALLQTGITALRRGATTSDYPEAIIACDSLAMGAVSRIPGINTIGIAAESDTDVPDIEIDVPCVIGVTDLLRSVSEDEIVIVDGYRGEVHIDPDPQTVAHYQQALERRNVREKVFITSEHIPARTQSGETIVVYARLRGADGLAESLEAGADGLLVDLRRIDDVAGTSGEVLREAAGKPVVFVVDVHIIEVLRAAMAYCTPGQMTLVAENAGLLRSQVESAMDQIVLEALQLDIEAPDVAVGGFARAGTCSPEDSSLLVIDTAENELEGLPAMHEDIVVIIGENLSRIEHLVQVGVRRIAVGPGRVADAKYAIRSIGSEDEA